MVDGMVCDLVDETDSGIIRVTVDGMVGAKAYYLVDEKDP